jgi:catechol 2,3-dioxygenase-like lactoylglutathione lyase family enzyme
LTTDADGVRRQGTGPFIPIRVLKPCCADPPAWLLGKIEIEPLRQAYEGANGHRRPAPDGTEEDEMNDRKQEDEMNDRKPLVTRTDFVFLPITSFENAEQFYAGVLGLPCSKRYDNELGGEFETGSLTIQVVDVAKIGREFAPSKGAIALHVDDVAAAREELEGKGVAFAGETIDSGVCHMAFFTDPDGNGLILHHRYAPKGEVPDAAA